MSEIKVFISYSHDSDEHREWVLSLSTTLNIGGVETILDQYVEGSPAERWYRWMQNSIDAASKVLCICTETYYQRFRGRAPKGEGRGVDWEGSIITQEIYDTKSTSDKFIPVLRSADDEKYIPEPLRGQSWYLIDTKKTNYDKLYDVLLGQAGVQPVRIGTKEFRPKKTGKPLQFDPIDTLSQQTQITNHRPETPWFSIELTVNNGQLQAADDNGQTASVAAAGLATEEKTKLAYLSSFLFDRFKQLQASQAIRLRIMTDDAVLGVLPWHQLPDPENGKLLTENGWVIETGPVFGSYQPTFQQINPHSPLLVIPGDTKHEIAADNHYSSVQSHLEAYLNINGPMPRVTTPQLLKQELNYHKPDLLYIYARFDGNHIILDTDQQQIDRLTLDSLAEWLKQAGLKPITILNLVGSKLNEFPQTLVSNSQLLWIQTTARKQLFGDLQHSLLTVLQHTADNSDRVSDLSSLIIKYGVEKLNTQNLLWLNCNSPTLNLDRSEQKQQQQIRAALLKVLLGRTALKDQMSGAITRALGNQIPVINYAVTGEPSACPHDVPDQIKHRLMWENASNSLPVIAYYLYVNLEQSNDIADTLDKIISEGLLYGSNNVQTIFLQQLDQRSLVEQQACISLNWLFRLDHQAAEQIEDWLEEWGQIVYEYLHNLHLGKCIVVNAVCLEIATTFDAQQLHDKANRILSRLRNHPHCKIERSIVKHALDRLDIDEIDDFLENDQRYWRQQLRLDQYQIQAIDFAEWLNQQTDGQFEETVKLIWQQYRSNYQGFLEHE